MRSGRETVLAALVGVAVVWGLSFVVIKDAVAAVAPSDLVGWRFALAAALLVIARPRTLMIMDVALLGRGTALGTLLGLGFWLCAVGLQTTSAVVSAFVVGTTVVFTPLVAWLWSGRRLARRTGVAVALALTGLALLTLRGASVGGGVLLILLAALLWAVHLCALGRWVRPRQTYASTVVQLVAAGAVALLAGLATGHRPRLPDAAALPATVYLGALATAAAFLALTWAQRRVDATTTAVLLTLEPVVGGAAAVLLLAEPVSAVAVAGALLVLAASALVLPTGRGPSPRPGPPAVAAADGDWVPRATSL